MKRSKPYEDEARYDLFILKITCPECSEKRVYRFKHEIDEITTCKCCNEKFMIGFDEDEDWDYSNVKVGYEVIVNYEDLEKAINFICESDSEYVERDQPIGLNGLCGSVLKMGKEKYGHFDTALVDFGDKKAWIDTRDLKIDRVRNQGKWY